MRSSQIMKILQEEHAKVLREWLDRVEQGLTTEQIVIQYPYLAGKVHQMNMIGLRVIGEED